EAFDYFVLPAYDHGPLLNGQPPRECGLTVRTVSRIAGFHVYWSLHVQCRTCKIHGFVELEGILRKKVEQLFDSLHHVYDRLRLISRPCCTVGAFVRLSQTRHPLVGAPARPGSVRERLEDALRDFRGQSCLPRRRFSLGPLGVAGAVTITAHSLRNSW